MYKSYDAFCDAMKQSSIAPGNPMAQSLETARSHQRAYLLAIGKLSPKPLVEVNDVKLASARDEVCLRILRPDAVATRSKPMATVVLVRGGGWWSGTLDTHDRTAREIAVQTGCPVCMVDYHHAPEAQFPTQRDQLISTLSWLHSSEAGHLGLNGRRSILFGESAGATLSLTASQYCRDTGLPQPLAMVLFYPNAAGPNDRSSKYSHWVWEQYLGSSYGDISKPEAVPLMNAMNDLCPIWLGVGEDDPLLFDAHALHEKLTNAGVPCIYKRYPGLPHGFVGFSNAVKPANDALMDACEAIRQFASSDSIQP